MNGNLPSPAVRHILNDLMDDVGHGGVWTEHGIKGLMDRYRDKLIAQANVNPREEARKILMELGTDKRIQTIKELRNRTGVGLKEAKDFILEETPGVIAANILKLQEELQRANSETDWGYRVNPQDLKPVNQAVNHNEGPF